MLKRPLSVEPVAAAFYVKKNIWMLSRMSFIIISEMIYCSCQEMKSLKESFSARGKMHPKSEEYIGDYLAIAINADK